MLQMITNNHHLKSATQLQLILETKNKGCPNEDVSLSRMAGRIG